MEESIVRMSYLHNPDNGSVPLAEVLLAGGYDRKNGWEWDFLEGLAAVGIEYVAQVKGKTWEQLAEIGLSPDEIKWLMDKLEMIKQ